MSAAVVHICVDPRLDPVLIRTQVRARLERLQLQAQRIYVTSDVGGNVGAGLEGTVSLLLQEREEIVAAAVLYHDRCLAADAGLRMSLPESADRLASLMSTHAVRCPILTGSILTESNYVTWTDSPLPTFEVLTFRMPRMYGVPAAPAPVAFAPESTSKADAQPAALPERDSMAGAGGARGRGGARPRQATFQRPPRPSSPNRTARAPGPWLARSREARSSRRGWRTFLGAAFLTISALFWILVLFAIADDPTDIGEKIGGAVVLTAIPIFLGAALLWVNGSSPEGVEK